MNRKVFIVNCIEVTDGNIDNMTHVFEDKISAQQYLKEFVQDELKYVEEKGWKIDSNTDDYFMAFEDGNLTNNYTEADLSEYEVKSHSVFNYDYQKEINILKSNLISDIRRIITTYGKDNGNCVVNDNQISLIWSGLTHVTVKGMLCVVDQVSCGSNDNSITIISDGVVIEIEDYENLYMIYNAVLDWFIDVATELQNIDMLHELCRMN